MMLGSGPAHNPGLWDEGGASTSPQGSGDYRTMLTATTWPSVQSMSTSLKTKLGEDEARLAGGAFGERQMHIVEPQGHGVLVAQGKSRAVVERRGGDSVALPL